MQTLLINRLPWEVFEREITGRGDEFSRSLLDDDISEMSQQPLKPIQYVPPPKKEGVTRQMGRWLDWLLRYVPEPVKKRINRTWNALKKKVMSLYPKQHLKFEESKRSALKGFAEEHTIKATNQTFDPKTFSMAKKDDKLSAQLDKHSPASRLVVSEERSKSKLRAVRQRMNGLSVRPTRKE